MVTPVPRALPGYVCKDSISKSGHTPGPVDMNCGGPGQGVNKDSLGNDSSILHSPEVLVLPHHGGVSADTGVICLCCRPPHLSRTLHALGVPPNPQGQRSAALQVSPYPSTAGLGSAFPPQKGLPPLCPQTPLVIVPVSFTVSCNHGSGCSCPRET